MSEVIEALAAVEEFERASDALAVARGRELACREQIERIRAAISADAFASAEMAEAKNEMARKAILDRWLTASGTLTDAKDDLRALEVVTQQLDVRVVCARMRVEVWTRAVGRD